MNVKTLVSQIALSTASIFVLAVCLKNYPCNDECYSGCDDNNCRIMYSMLMSLSMTSLVAGSYLLPKILFESVPRNENESHAINLRELERINPRSNYV